MWAQRIAWLVAIWAGSVMALGLVALLLRGAMGWAGMAG
jgi:hypothetical protein